MLKDLQVGDIFPDIELPDENGIAHRLSELQGDDTLVLMLGRGEHCPRERQHQREMLKLPEAPHNLAWGDPDGRTLYITALTGVYRLRLT